MATAKPIAKPAVKKSTAKTTTAKKAPSKKVTPQTASVKKAVTSAEKTKKPKMIRDSFTMPKDEYVNIDALKQRAIKLGQVAKKSELLRAGIKALTGMSDIQFKAALSNVPTIKTGRPKNAK
jgi:hypothetical protein